METTSNSLPITGSLTLAYVCSLIVALLMGGSSIAGLLYQSAIYPTGELLQTFVANDVVNLVIGLPILLLSIWWAQRGKLIGLLLWPGALFYVMYNYMVYVLAMPLSVMFVFHLVLVTLSLYTMFGLVGIIDGEAVQQRLAGAVPERWAGGVLAGLGGAFGLRAVGIIAAALINKTPVPAAEVALLTTDFMINPAWVIGGILLWQRRASGYVMGLGLLFQGSMLFIGLIVFLMLQPILTDAPFALVDIIVTFILGLICFIPFTLFVRGAAADRNGAPG